MFDMPLIMDTDARMSKLFSPSERKVVPLKVERLCTSKLDAHRWRRSMPMS
jgi:hypothetical protein